MTETTRDSAHTLMGTWFDGQNSQLHPGTLSRDEEGIVTLSLSGTPQLQCRLTELIFSRRIGNTRRIIGLPQGSSFDTDDNDTVDQWQKQAQPRFWNLTHRFESTWPGLLLTVSILLLSSAWVVLEGLAAASDKIAEKLPSSINKDLGARSLAALDDEVLLPSRLELRGQKQIRSYFESALKKFPGTPMRVLFRDGGNMGPNAMALPDGTLIFTDQLIALSHTQEELMAVLAHEIGHVIFQHSLRTAVRNMLTNLAVTALSGKAAFNSDLLLSAPLFMLEQSYSRKFEEDADNFALEFLIDYDLSPQHFSDIMSRMERAETCIPEADAAPEAYDVYYQQTIACYRKFATLSRDEIKALPAPVADAHAHSSFWGYMSSHPTTPDRLKRFSEAR